MSETEKKIAENIAKAWNHMDDRSQGYLLGFAEAMAANAKEKEKEEKEKEDDEQIPNF